MTEHAAYLTIESGDERCNGGPITFPLEHEITLIGRGTNNHLVLADRAVSREHVRIVRRGSRFAAENLNAKNRMLLNGRPVRKDTLSDGDRLGLGGTLLVFRQPVGEAPTAAAEPGYIAVDAHDRDVAVGDIDEASVRDLRRARSNLLSLYRAGRIVNASLHTKDLCDKTLTTILEEMPAVDCCSIHLLNPESAELECRASRTRQNAPDGGTQPFSRTVLEKVVGEMQAILTYDAQDDGRFDDSSSIAFLNMRSAMCVPLQVQDRLTGVIQAHTLDPRKPFDVQDLKLLTAFGMLAGVAIENASLYETLDAERMKQTEKARLMQVMVHELKSPIGVARQMADVLQQGYVPEEKRTHVLERIIARLDNMLERITETLVFTRLRSGEAIGEVTVIDLCSHVRTVAESYRDQADAKGLGFDIDVPAEAVNVSIEEGNLELILSNLVSNAVKYTAAGSVRVAVAVEGRTAFVTVKDTGMGIPEKDLQNLFAEFFRASNAKRSGIDGTGIGLASVKCIAERAGGGIGVESEEGAGSAFRVRLPLHTD